MSNSVTEEESVPIDETQLFDWACSNAELLNLEAFLSRTTRSQRKEIFYFTKFGDQNVLHMAAACGCSDILAALLEVVSDLHMDDIIDSKCKNGMTPLHYAAKSFHISCIKLLVYAGANVNSLNVARNTPLHLAALNFQAFMLPSFNRKSYSCIKFLVSQPDINLSTHNMDGKTTLSVSSNYWIQHIEWDRSLATKLEEWRRQVSQAEEMVTEWRYFCNGKPIQHVTEIICPRLSSFDLYDTKLTTGCFYDDDYCAHPVSIKILSVEAREGDPHLHVSTVAMLVAARRAAVREVEVLNLLKSELTEAQKRRVNLPYGNTTLSPEYLVLPYVPLDLNGFMNHRSDLIVDLIYKAICAVSVVHSLNIMHGDIKPHNFNVRVHQHGHFQVLLSNFDYAVVVADKLQGKNAITYYPDQTGYLRYEHPWVAPEIYSMHGRTTTAEADHLCREEASLAIDVFSLGLLIGVAVDSDCCSDHNKRMYDPKDIDKILTNQSNLTEVFRKRKCRNNELARKLLVCATNMMCLIDPLQRCSIDDILREIDL